MKLSFFHAVIQLLLEVLLFTLYPIISIVNFFVKEKVSYPNNPDGKTIIIVERWLHKNIIHLYWKKYLEKKGYRVYLIYHPLGKETFYQSAVKLKQFVEKEKLTNVTLVGISSGGITSLFYLQNLSGWEKVSTFISIGSPFKGTIMALLLAYNHSCRELLPGSKTVRKLRHEELQNKHRIICLVPKLDEVVPTSSAALPGTKKIKIDAYGHNYLHMLCRKTYDTIAEYASKT